MSTENMPDETTTYVEPEPEKPAAEIPAPEETKVEAEAAPEGAEEPKAETPESEAKPKKTAEELAKENRRLLKRLNRAKEQLEQAPLQHASIDAINRQAAGDSEELSGLTKADLARLVEQRAQERLEYERRHTVVKGLAEQLGDRFDVLTKAADIALGGFLDRNQRLTPATEAIFALGKEAGAVIEYLANEDNEDEAEAIGRMGPAQAGVAIGKLQASLARKPESPKPSKAAPVVEPIKGGGQIAKTIFDLSGDEFDRRRREQVARRR